MRILGTLLLLYALPAVKDNPVAKVPLGKDTSVAMGPLDKEGYIDYEVALNERLGKGITAERNANVLIWQASVRSRKAAGACRPSSSNSSVSPHRRKRAIIWWT